MLSLSQAKAYRVWVLSNWKSRLAANDDLSIWYIVTSFSLSLSLSSGSGSSTEIEDCGVEVVTRINGSYSGYHD